ncbi:MAG: hypothetical protein EBR82_15040 [Caulobacteraceae bacterium]|nr:hypothetical protein [Caulobacteraceae bacterium]
MYIKNPTAGVKAVAEITQGTSNERSADGGELADVSVRTWRLLLESPSSSYSVQQAVGVFIGDPHPVNTDLPCVSFSEKPDGESRVTRIVTATYRTTPGSGGDNGQDPNKQQPNIRPAKFTITSGLMEMPTTEWIDLDNVFNNRGEPNFVPATNPVGDMYDGISVPSPVITVSIEQFDNYPTLGLEETGQVNKDDFEFLGLSVWRYTCMLRGINVRPAVEAFGDLVYRGFVRTFEFVIRPRGGWKIKQVIEGFNIKNDGLGRNDVYQDGLALVHKNGRVQEPPNGQKTLVKPGEKVRAVIPIHSLDGGWMQRPSAQPVALNIDGTPRNVDTQIPKVLTKQYITSRPVTFGNNFVNFGVRVEDII